MNSKSIIITFLASFAIVGIMFWGYGKNGNTAAAVQGVDSAGVKSQLVAAETFYDFGTISMKNGNVTKDFILTNSTSTDVIIKGVETSCMCTSAFLVLPDGSIKGPFGMRSMGGMTMADEIIKVGESRTLRVVYNPNAHGPAGVGNIDRFAIVTDASGGAVQFEIKAVVTP